MAQSFVESKWLTDKYLNIKKRMPFGLGDELSADQVMAIIQRSPVLAERCQFAQSAGIARAYEIAQRERYI